MLSTSSKVMIDQQANNGNSLMYLPIDKIIEGGQRRSTINRSQDNVMADAGDETVIRTESNRRGR